LKRGVKACRTAIDSMGVIHHLLVSAIREAVVPNIQSSRPTVVRHVARLSNFAVLFRAQADQARRLDALDATLGVVLAMLLVILPLALTTAHDIDEIAAACIFTVPIGIVSRALFSLGGEVPQGVLVGKQFVRDFLRGGSRATRILARILEDDYVILGRKKALLRAAYLTTVLSASGNAILHGSDLDDHRHAVVYSHSEVFDAGAYRGGSEDARPADGQDAAARPNPTVDTIRRQRRGLRPPALIRT
jgi:hypothetical protein